MDTFREREKGFEAKFAHDMEVAFLARTRANYQAGLWAAELMGKTGEDARAYAETIRIEDFHGKGPRAVAERIEADLAGRASATEIDAKINAFRAQAERDLRAGNS